jgi:ParB family chromosome partitioning protein
MAEILRLELTSILPDPNQPRKGGFSGDDMESLIASLKKYGQKNPLGVRRDGGRGQWILVRGERRFRGLVAAGFTHADCIEVTGIVTKADLIKDQLIDNMLRADLSPLEIARALEEMQTLEGGTLASVAASLDISPATATRCTALLALPPDMQMAISDGRLNARSGYAIARLSDAAGQRELFELAIEGKLTCTQAEERVHARMGKRQSKPKGAKVCVKENGVSLLLSGPSRESLLGCLEQLVRALRGELKSGVATNA